MFDKIGNKQQQAVLGLVLIGITLTLVILWPNPVTFFGLLILGCGGVLMTFRALV
jgi:hypothetical protein